MPLELKNSWDLVHEAVVGTSRNNNRLGNEEQHTSQHGASWCVVHPKQISVYVGQHGVTESCRSLGTNTTPTLRTSAPPQIRLKQMSIDIVRYTTFLFRLGNS